MPLGDRHQHDIHDTDAADEEAHAGDAGEQERVRLLGCLASLEELLLIIDGKVIGLPREYPVLGPQDPFDIHHRDFQRYAVRHPDADIVEVYRTQEARLGGAQRQ